MNNKKKKSRAFLFINLALLLAGIIAASAYLYGVFHRVTKSPVAEGADRNGKWLADLTFLRRELPKKHRNLFFSLSEEEFYSEMDGLIAKIPESSDFELKAELARIVNRVGDPHTSVAADTSLLYPLGFFEFDEGIYLSNTTPEYSDFWGKKLLSVNGYPVEDIRAMLLPYVSHDNAAILKTSLCAALTYPEMLRMAGIVSSDGPGEAVFDFEGGGSEDIRIAPSESKYYEGNVFMKTLPGYADRFPPYTRNAKQEYWFEYIPEAEAIYVKYNACSQMKGYSFASFTRDVFKEFESRNAKKLIIDLRDNGGGNSTIFSPMVREVRKRPDLNQKENLFVIIGRRTFSSAVLNAMDMRNKTNATLVGEPTGGRPNHFGEVKHIYLTNVRIDVAYSSKYFKTSGSDTDSIYPDVEIPIRASSYFTGRDDFIDRIVGK